MLPYALMFATGCFCLALLMNLSSVIMSSGVPDRILALDTMVINFIAILVLFGIIEGTAIFFEVSILIAMVGFISTVAYARFMLRGNIIE
ncbi:MAG: K+/H+ antiporter subunit F [Proteobacteria bacterium]|nr:K+/H+ antiporter subunit F [Pseudomonadota bacterium]